jgi:hypothetical protein
MSNACCTDPRHEGRLTQTQQKVKASVTQMLKISFRQSIEQVVGMPWLQQKAGPPWSLIYWRKEKHARHDGRTSQAGRTG